jgi:DNA-binding NarL/FixJ family response regulator
MSRETDVLRLIATGDANKEIAGRLSISEETVKYPNILAKLGAIQGDRSQEPGVRTKPAPARRS